MRPRRARRIARLYGGAALCGFFAPETFDKMNTYAVTGTFHGSIVYANCEGDARRAFHKKYNGELITHIHRIF